MLGSILGGALGVGGAIFGNISASRAMRRVKEGVEKEKRENEDWYNRRYNEDATQRADAQRALELARESIRQRNRQAAGTQAVMGGTEESVAATKAASGAAMADAVSQVAAAGERRKDDIEKQYQARKGELGESLRGMEAQKAANTMQTAAAMARLRGSIAGAIDHPGPTAESAGSAEAAGEHPGNEAASAPKQDKYSIMDDAYWMERNGYA